MKTLLLIFVSGGLGSLARFGIAQLNTPGQFPLGTFTANILACFIAGFAAGIFISRTDLAPEIKFAVLTGFCGGFSTFSTFSLEAFTLMQSGKAGIALFYTFSSLAACFAATWAGFEIARRF